MSQALPKASDDGYRLVEWVGSAERIGLARQPTGAIEVFVKGDRLAAKSGVVARHMKHDDWIGEPGRSFQANRIVFPAEPHFVAVAAFVAEELLRHSVDSVPQAAFEMAEPIVEMALRGIAVAEEAQLGLFGELYLLFELLRVGTSSAAQARCVEAWRGYQQSSRDFVFPDGIEVEVKSTSRPDSTHSISHLAQIDPQRNSSGIPIEQLYLVSVGVTPDDAKGRAIPDLVEGILTFLGRRTDAKGRNAIQNLFVNLVAQYGGHDRGYIHDEMKTWTAYAARWSVRWDRTYNMNDELIRVLRRQDLAALPHIDPESVALTVRLPTEIVSMNNPTRGVDGLVAHLMG